jgi:hypothetical protein
MLPAILLSLAATAASPNACQVLTPREVGRVQGTKYKKTRLSETSDAGIAVSQCYYALPHHTDSVTVDLIRGKARDFFESHFPLVTTVSHRAATVRPVAGVGERAVWTASRVAGALYVLSGETVVRVSLGGNGNEEQRIDRARRLAANVVRRLRS